MSRYIFCSLTSPGFLYPAMGLACELRQRGHAVGFVTDPEADASLSPLELSRITGETHNRNCFSSSLWSHPLCIALQTKHIEYAVDRFEPDVLVGQQLTFGPMIVRERRRVPLAVFGFSTYLWPADDGPPMPEPSEAEKRKRWRHADMMRIYNEARALLRLPKVQATCRETPLGGDLLMVRSVPELEGDIGHLPERVHLVGPCLWEDDKPDPELNSWLEAAVATGGPIIYAQHGRFFDQPHFWPHLVEALGGQGASLAASSGRLDCPLGELPPNFFVRPHVSQGRVLRHASAAIASANSTAVLGALAAGVPVVLIPAGGEQPDVAECCARAGAGVCISASDARPELITSELRRLLEDNRPRDAARRIAAAFSAWPGFETAADLLEALAASRCPVLRSDQIMPARECLQ